VRLLVAEQHKSCPQAHYKWFQTLELPGRRYRLRGKKEALAGYSTLGADLQTVVI